MLLYLDASSSGISGDMFLAGLLDLGFPFGKLKDLARRLGLTGVRLRLQRVRHGGFSAARIAFQEREPRFFRTRQKIHALLDQSALSATLKGSVQSVFEKLFEVEAAVHGVALRRVVLRQLAGVDTILCIAGVCAGLDFLQVRRIFVSPVAVGSFHEGHQGLPHRTFGPATRRLLNRFQTVQRKEDFEWTTPTGAALLSVLACQEPMPPFLVSRIGYGAGHRFYGGASDQESNLAPPETPPVRLLSLDRNLCVV